MDDFMSDLDRLLAKARMAGQAPLLDSAETLRRIASFTELRPLEASSCAFDVPGRVLLGIGSAAAAGAAVVVFFAAPAFSLLSDPLNVMCLLPDFSKFLNQ